MIFLTSDSHHKHNNILRYCNRPFLNAEEMELHKQNIPFKPSEESTDLMDKTLIERLNSKVGRDDVLYHLGDFCLGTKEDWINIREQINCNNIFLCLGNHDKENRIHPKLFKKIHAHGSAIQIKVNGQRIILNHYAMRTWNKSHHGTWHLYGHSHGTLPDLPHSLSMDVGVDTNNFYPYSMDDISEIMSKKEFKPIDHHRN